MTNCSEIASHWWKNIWGRAQSISSSHVPGSCMGNPSIAVQKNKDTATWDSFKTIYEKDEGIGRSTSDPRIVLSVFDLVCVVFSFLSL